MFIHPAPASPTSPASPIGLARNPLASLGVSTRALIITALVTGLVILVAFTIQVLIAV